MSDFIKSQIDVRNNLIAQAREVIDVAQAEARGLSDEENTKIARIEADIDQADAAIESARKLSERENRAAEAAASFAPSNETRSTDGDILRSIAMGETRGHEFARELRTLVPSSNTVGQSFYDQVFEIAQLVGPMLTTSEVFNTSSGENLVIPTVTATSTAGSVAAAGTISESNPTFSSITLGADKYAAMVQVAQELVDDAGFNITSYIAQQLGTSLGLAANSALTTKLSAAADEVLTGGTGVAGAASYEDLITLVYGIADGARVLPGLGFQMSKSGIAAARKLKDASGAYIWTNSAVPGQPATLLGYPVFENPNIAAVALGAKSVLFGHLPSFKVRVAGGIRVDQSADYAFNTDTVTYRGLIRLDGGLTHATHIGCFKGGAS
jgi:HK97 family phage major capsid protein